MIYIATIHWKINKWTDIQREYIDRAVSSDYKLYCCLDSSLSGEKSKYDFVIEDNERDHAAKLNKLGAVILEHAEPEDVLIFIDGDAFPVFDDFGEYIFEKLKNFPLLAIQRLENGGDRKPHPSFCCTTVKFWKEIQGNWKEGFRYNLSSGQTVTDPGANLLKLLNDRNIEWYPLLRSNKKNMHPIFFGVYDNVIYHHGAGFREPLSRFDMVNYSNIFHWLSHRILTFSPISKQQKSKWDPLDKVRRKIIERNGQTEKTVFGMIENDKDFYQYFI